MREMINKEERPFKIGWSYKLTIAINCVLSLIGIACIIMAIVCGVNNVDTMDNLVPIIIAGGALVLMGVMCGLTGLFHFRESDVNREEPSFAYAIIAGVIALAVGTALILFSLIGSSAFVTAHFTALLVMGVVFIVIGVMSIGVSGWFVSHRKRIENGSRNL